MKMIPAHAPPHDLHELVKSLAILLKEGKEMSKVKDVFEEKVKNLLQTDNYLTVSSGRRALYGGLKSLGIGKGDEIILPAFTADIVPMVIRETGAIPIPADVNLDDYNINIESISRCISNRTKAILTVHTFGYPSDLKALREVCDDHNLFLVEDAAPAFGAKYGGISAGTFGDFGIVSFGVGKSISMGTGGGLIVSNKKIFKEIKKRIEPKGFKNSIKIFAKIFGSILLSNPQLYGNIGYRVKDTIVSHQYDNFREEIVDMKDIPLLSYAIGIQEIERRVFERRREIALEYNNILKNFEGLYLPTEKENVYSVYTRYFVRVESEDIRNNICGRMRNFGIEPLVPDHGYPISKSLYPSGVCDIIPNAKILSRTLIGVPVHIRISENKLNKIFKIS